MSIALSNRAATNTTHIVLALLALVTQLTHADAGEATESKILPRPAPIFNGDLNPRASDSTPYTVPPAPKAPANAPNIVLIMTDDVGFGAASAFGGPIATPNLERLANQGLMYNRFHTTGVCSPSRASLLTGRNHHAVGAGHHPEMASPYPGYTGVIPKSAASIARILRDNGYNTAMFGKDHNIPLEHRSPMGPFDHWPTSRGFEFFYGFLNGDVDQYNPVLYRGTQLINSVDRDDDYLLDRDLVDQTITWLHQQQGNSPEKPFFIYQALGSAHAPQQAPKEWIEKFAGHFDHGWNDERELTLNRQKARGLIPEETVLTAWPDNLPTWASLSEKEQKIHARFMEVYAAMLSYQDDQFGRILDELDRMGIAENTLIIFIQGDNGAATGNGPHGSINELPDMGRPSDEPQYDINWLAENLAIMGGPLTYQAIPAGWSVALNTPFPWFKRLASHLGAVRNGLIISWPARVKAAGLREQYHHIVDIFPSILEAADITPPTEVDGVQQQAIDGVSMLYSFDEQNIASPRTTQYYEISGNYAIYHNGWLAAVSPEVMPWDRKKVKTKHPADYTWELYNLNDDFNQAKDLAEQYPARLEAMKATFDTEARRNQVYPLQNTGGRERAAARGVFASKKTELNFWGNNVQVGEWSAPNIFRQSFSIDAQINLPESGGNGVIFAAGSHFGGWSFYLIEGKPVLAAAHSPVQDGIQRVASGVALTTGPHHLTCDVDFSGHGANITIFADGRQIATGRISQRPLRIAGQGETYDAGKDSNAPVSPDYRDEGIFNGDILKVTLGIQ